MKNLIVSAISFCGGCIILATGVQEKPPKLLTDVNEGYPLSFTSTAEVMIDTPDAAADDRLTKKAEMLRHRTVTIRRNSEQIERDTRTISANVSGNSAGNERADTATVFVKKKAWPQGSRRADTTAKPAQRLTFRQRIERIFKRK